MSKLKKAWLHKANDNYYTDEQFQKELAHQPWMIKSYIPFIEEVTAIGQKVMEQHSETFLKLRISELEEEIQEKNDTIEQLHNNLLNLEDSLERLEEILNERW